MDASTAGAFISRTALRGVGKSDKETTVEVRPEIIPLTELLDNFESYTAEEKELLFYGGPWGDHLWFEEHFKAPLWMYFQKDNSLRAFCRATGRIETLFKTGWFGPLRGKEYESSDFPDIYAVKIAEVE